MALDFGVYSFHILAYEMLMEELHTDSIDVGRRGQLCARSRAWERATPTEGAMGSMGAVLLVYAGGSRAKACLLCLLNVGLFLDYIVHTSAAHVGSVSQGGPMVTCMRKVCVRRAPAYPRILSVILLGTSPNRSLVHRHKVLTNRSSTANPLL